MPLRRSHTAELITLPLILLTSSCSNPEPTQSKYLDENPAAQQAEIKANTSEPDPAPVEVEEPDPTIKGSFVNVTYTLDAPPTTTTGDDATFNPETGIFTYYDTIQQGDYKGYNYNFE